MLDAGWYAGVECDVIKEYRQKFSLREIELHHKQLSWNVQSSPSGAIHFQKFLQKTPVVESFFWSNYRLTVQSIDNADCSRLNLGARGEHLTSQLSWIAVWQFVKRVCPVHLVDRYDLNIRAMWGREKSLVQQLERGICPKSILDCGSSIKESGKFNPQHQLVAWWLWRRTPTTEAPFRFPGEPKHNHRSH